MTESISTEQLTAMRNDAGRAAIRADEERDTELDKLSEYVDILVDQVLCLKGELYLAAFGKTLVETLTEVWDEMDGEQAQEVKRLTARVAELEDALASPCDGTRCEQSGAAHCHACAEATLDKVLAERDQARKLVRSLGIKLADALKSADVHQQQAHLGEIKIDALREENKRLRGHDANLLARQLADRTDELTDTRKALEDLRSLYTEYGIDCARGLQQASAKTEEAREIARCLKRMYAPHPDPHGYLAAALGLEQLPAWLAKGY